MTRFARIARDICLIVVGVIGLTVVPPSMHDIGVFGVLGYIWATMIGGGALASLVGVLLNRAGPEIWGCSLVGGGFFVWAVAAMTMDGANLVSVMVALVFLSGTAGQFYRVGMVAERRVDRT